jgi:hypothetical protein
MQFAAFSVLAVVDSFAVPGVLRRPQRLDKLKLAICLPVQRGSDVNGFFFDAE